MKRNLFGLTKFVTLVFAAFLLNSCASFTMVAITMDPKYGGMMSSPSGNERVIDRIVLEGTDDKEYADKAPSNGPMGAPYEVVEDIEKGPERHKHEVMLEKLLNAAKEKYPSETVDIRNAANRYNCNVSRSERVIKQYSSSGNHVYGTKNYYRCRVFHVADIVVAEPMPEPVTHSVELSLADVSRADLYRRIANWLADAKYVEGGSGSGVRLETDLAAGLDLGRIKGDYVFYLTSGQNDYIITSTFTIDVHDEKAEMSFKNTRLQRNKGGDEFSRSIANALNAKVVNWGDEESIFLQSVANAVQAGIVSFSENLKNGVTR